MIDDTEVWKDVVGYEGLYKVSNLGRVMSLKFGKEKIMKPRNHVRGYLNVRLCKDGQSRECTVHKLVATAFLTKPEPVITVDCWDGTEYKDYNFEVNHKNEIKQCNDSENLEWCTRNYNINYGTCRQRAIKTHEENLRKKYSEIPDGTIILWD